MKTINTDGYSIESYDVAATDFGESPYADIVIAHRDGFKLHIHITRPYHSSDSVSLEVIAP